MKKNIAPHAFFIAAYTLLIMTEGMILPLLYANGLNVGLVKALLFMKYGIVTVLFMIFIVRNITSKFKKLYYYELLGIFLACYNAVYVLLTNAIFGQTSVSRITLFIFPIVSYFAGRALKVTYDDFVIISKIVIILFLANTLYGICDVFFLDASLWADILQQERYLIDVKSYTGGIYRGVIGNFYFDPWVLAARRLIGTLGDPLAYAYSSVLPICLILYMPISSRFELIKKYTFFIIGLIGISMSMTRAVLLSTMIILPLKNLLKRYLLPSIITIAIVLLIFLSSAGFILQTIAGLNDSSTKGHLFSLAEIYNLSFFEFFLGSIMGDSGVAFESGFLNYIVVLGSIMAILFYSFIYKLLTTLLNCNLPLGIAVGVCGTIGLFTSFVFSESFFSFTGYGLFWLCAGIMAGIIRDKRYVTATI